MKLYVRDIVRKPKDTLYTFLYKVLQLNTKYSRFSVKDTYFDSEFKEPQCGFEKRRSFDDLVLISKTYFRVSDKAVAKVIKKILDEDQYSSLVLCDTAKKWVLNTHITKSDNIKYCAIYHKSDLKTNENWEGKYSFDDIIALMGLTKEDVKINN